MKFVSMKKVHEGKFLSRYDIVYAVSYTHLTLPTKLEV